MSRIVCDLTRISRCCGQYRSRHLEAFGLSPRQASLLLEICLTPGISQDMLARRVFLNKSVVARALASLEESGFVQRLCCQKDKRVTRLYPTEHTLQIQPQLQTIDDDCEQLFTDGMSPQEITVLQNILDKLQAKAAKWTEGDCV